MLMRYKSGLALILLVSVVVGSVVAAPSKSEPEDNNASIADRLVEFEDSLEHLEKENARLRGEIDDIVRQCNERFENLNDNDDSTHKLLTDGFKSRLAIEQLVLEIAGCQTQSSVLVNWLVGGAYARDTDASWYRRAKEVFEKSEKNMHKSKEILDAEMKPYQGVKHKERVETHHIATINGAVERWYINRSYWPAFDLSDIGADKDYFPGGIPRSPVDGHSYSLDPATHRVR